MSKPIYFGIGEHKYIYEPVFNPNDASSWHTIEVMANTQEEADIKYKECRYIRNLKDGFNKINKSINDKDYDEHYKFHFYTTLNDDEKTIFKRIYPDFTRRFFVTNFDKYVNKGIAALGNLVVYNDPKACEFIVVDNVTNKVVFNDEYDDLIEDGNTDPWERFLYDFINWLRKTDFTN